MNFSPFSGIIRFVGLVLLQVLIFNRMNLFGLINPMVYILFLYWYPLKENRSGLLGWAFALGFVIDLFSDTMAMHTAACITAAFFRPAIMRFVFGINLEFQNFSLPNSTRVQQFTFLALLIGVHHLIFFTLEIFSLTNLLLILKRVLLTGVCTFIFSILLAALFSARKT
ncbi:rod shape-determining protein MreD [Robiginitalea myxolifaciens]|uniref:Rod shape-determining protein MreD n=1 Tax=Robiginitalea myxolifaciens TaxID=400055 RepID=A0A1I6GB21_9FLAO|nr:rod shape-determining protein MreD [Robiginitalea myxolifaciens]SFR39384.1 rod shape-determining protein MreD [Robiginitalea myxolifaciens]